MRLSARARRKIVAYWEGQVEKRQAEKRQWRFGAFSSATLSFDQASRLRELRRKYPMGANAALARWRYERHIAQHGVHYRAKAEPPRTWSVAYLDAREMTRPDDQWWHSPLETLHVGPVQTWQIPKRPDPMDVD